MFKFAATGFLGFVISLILTLGFYVGVFFGFMWVLEYFGIIEMIKEVVKK